MLVAAGLMVLDGAAAHADDYSYTGAYSYRGDCELDRSYYPPSPPEFLTYPCAWHDYDPQPWLGRGPRWYWLQVHVEPE